MCSVDAPAPTVIEADKPTLVRNPYLDETDNDVASADALRRGRSSLVIPTGTGLGFSGRDSIGSGTSGGAPNGNARGPMGSGGGRLAIPGGSGPFVRGGDYVNSGNTPRNRARGNPGPNAQRR